MLLLTFRVVADVVLRSGGDAVVEVTVLLVITDEL
jgi:hypothetical protein